MRACQVCTAENDAFLCRLCFTELERDLGDMTSLMHEVSVLATGQTNVYRASGRPREDTAAIEQWDQEEREIPARLRSTHGRIALPATALMVNLDARELLWVAGNTLSTWARHLAESRGVDMPTAAGLLTWLTHYAESIRWDEAASEMHDEVTALHRDLERAVDRSPSRFYAGPCRADNEGRCCTRDLYGKLTDHEVRCDGFRDDGRGCGAVHTLTDRRDFLMDSVDDALVPMAVLRDCSWSLFRLTWPPLATIRSWVLRGRVVAKGIDRSGSDLFRAGDVIDMVKDWGSGSRATARRAKSA